MSAPGIVPPRVSVHGELSGGMNGRGFGGASDGSGAGTPPGTPPGNPAAGWGPGGRPPTPPVPPTPGAGGPGGPSGPGGSAHEDPLSEPPRERRRGRSGSRVSSVRRTEGPRGASTRAAVFARYAAYLLVIIACSGAAHAFFGGESRWQSGGKWMLFSSCTILATGALGTVMITSQRNEIVRQTRHFVFGLSLFPGVGLAFLMWAARGLTGNAAIEGDAFLSLLSTALPIVYFCTVMIPPMVFIKTIAGMRTLNRSQLDDQEMLNLYARQDHLQR